jgi:hypothetical protein
LAPLAGGASPFTAARRKKGLFFNFSSKIFNSSAILRLLLSLVGSVYIRSLLYYILALLSTKIFPFALQSKANG